MKRVIGLMSGTSLDGIDAALIETDGEAIAAFGPGETVEYSRADRTVLQAAVDTALAWGFEGKMPVFDAAEDVLTRRHGELVARLIGSAGLEAADIDLIGFHGQTVLHRAPTAERAGRTLQIGSGRALADTTGIPVVFDFRSEDVARGGQGAPLATLYHAALGERSGLEGPLAVLNLGGVANVTWLAPAADPVAFDTGPANGLIDAWCARHTEQSCDRDGKLAASGHIDAGSLDRLLAHPFFAMKPPKSLDRWDFTLEPVERLGVADGAATLTAFTAQTVADAIGQLGHPRRLLVTGGGRHNPVLMRMIGERLGTVAEPVETVGWRGDLLEAEAFAWLAARVERGLPTSLPSTTGVREPVSGGRLVRPSACR
jgi:anhydro-N-acetylmuramic acid kinase